MTMATILVSLAGIYLLIGVVFAVPFVLKGAARIDASAKASTWGFRVMIFPGCVMLWPVLLRRWLAVGKGAVS